MSTGVGFMVTLWSHMLCEYRISDVTITHKNGGVLISGSIPWFINAEEAKLLSQFSAAKSLRMAIYAAHSNTDLAPRAPKVSLSFSLEKLLLREKIENFPGVVGYFQQTRNMEEEYEDMWDSSYDELLGFSEDEEQAVVIDEFPEDLQSWVYTNIGPYELKRNPAQTGLILFDNEPRIRFIVDGTVLLSIKCDERIGFIFRYRISLQGIIDAMKELLPLPIEPIVIKDTSIQSVVDKILPLPLAEETLFGIPAKDYILSRRKVMKRGQGLASCGHFVLYTSDNMIYVEDNEVHYQPIKVSVLTSKFEVTMGGIYTILEHSWTNLEDRLLEFAGAKVLFIDGVPY